MQTDKVPNNVTDCTCQMNHHDLHYLRDIQVKETTLLNLPEYLVKRCPVFA